MQLRSLGRFRITRNIVDLGKEIVLSWTEGGGVANCELEDRWGAYGGRFERWIDMQLNVWGG